MMPDPAPIEVVGSQPGRCPAVGKETTPIRRDARSGREDGVSGARAIELDC
jgi:hypothetical protein